MIAISSPKQRLLGLTILVMQSTREHILLISQKSDRLLGMLRALLCVPTGGWEQRWCWPNPPLLAARGGADPVPSLLTPRSVGCSVCRASPGGHGGLGWAELGDLGGLFQLE